VSLVALGASWGGLDAIRTLLGRLPANLGAPIVVAQHRAAESHAYALRDILAAATRLHVREAADKDRLEDGTVYLAPPDYHLLVEEEGTLALSTDALVMWARPSIDVLFESAAEAYRERCAAVVLTGANADGAAGLARVAELGGAALVQEPANAERAEMPRAALAAVPSARVGELPELADALATLCGTKAIA
jgi:two-component system chemotaxis response regulator CheB